MISAKQRLAGMVRRCFLNYMNNDQSHEQDFNGVSVQCDQDGVIKYFVDGDECIASDAIDHIDDRGDN